MFVRRKLLTGVSAGLTVLAMSVLAACGNTGGSAAGAEGAGDGGGELKIEDSETTVTLDEPAVKVVALEYSYIEDLLALGIDPVGVADKAGYHQWVTAGPRIPKSTEDVGTRQEPSIEAIQALSPDLIITDATRAATSVEQLKGIAPTLLFDPTRQDMNQWTEMRTTFSEIAKAVGKQERGEQVLQSLDEKLAADKQQLADAGLDGAPVALSQGFTQESAPLLRMFTPKAQAGAILGKLGLNNAWEGKPDEWGFTTVDVEALTSVSSSHFMYVADPADNPYTGALAENPVWKGLGFVKEDRLHALDPGTWTFGGPLSCELVADEVVKALTS